MSCKGLGEVILDSICDHLPVFIAHSHKQKYSRDSGRLLGMCSRIYVAFILLVLFLLV